MEFYVSWSHSDALYCEYFNNCPILISAVPDNKNALRKFKKLPSKLMIDSGAIYYVRKGLHYTVKEIFERQLFIAMPLLSTCPITFVHVDEPLLNKVTLAERYGAFEKTLINAYEYMNLVRKQKIDTNSNVTILGVIQGYDFPSIQFSIFELKKLGYHKFGLGSLLGRNMSEQMQFISWAAELVGAGNLHVFGVTGIPQIQAMGHIGISSFDSSRPTKVAVYHQIFYSNPFRTYLIKHSGIDRGGQKISTPLHCECPVCEENALDLMNLTHQKYTKLRSIHNYYHFLKTIQPFLRKEYDVNVVSNVLRS
ncbi:queuine tRNA-ribosyltransferase [Bacillus sp. 165]|uniref:queuine tRNA-ribosyltransferase n=1 Tax=Bacillus sp. 165 TaxID=1529117 RepID=UPI001AD98650|nr:queuine tRNA-ribosyltransferase [Bacillus sp. 165]MBO9128586.1 queuine tRNA-ribosyltransferase [Bacillus sp. 165]